MARNIREKRKMKSQLFKPTKAAQNGIVSHLPTEQRDNFVQCRCSVGR